MIHAWELFEEFDIRFFSFSISGPKSVEIAVPLYHRPPLTPAPPPPRMQVREIGCIRRTCSNVTRCGCGIARHDTPGARTFRNPD
jgi:hypothetical protein